MKRILIVTLSLIFLSLGGFLSAKGTQEKDFQEAQGKDNFNQTVDLTTLTPGQYNLLVRTKDAAGNVAYAGPYNFYYDPASDNPLVTVANPSPGMRVTSSMNFVGVTSAPKGVAKVEVQVDGGDWAQAKGKAFWSYYLNAQGMTDGLHTVSVRGTDVNGLVGPVNTVPFNLDKNLPVFTLTTLKSGDRVSGQLVLKGTLADGNGLKLLELSTNNQKTFVPLNLEGDQKAVVRTFTANLDTRTFPDGPLVLYFHGTDGQGSEVRQAVLLYVDNTVPVITVLSPPATQGLHGKVRFVVQVEKTLGIRSLTARVGEKGEPVTLPVIPGNPFHIADLTLPATGNGTIPVTFEAVDTAGKPGILVFQAKLNGDIDLPSVTLSPDLEKTQVRAPLHIVGTLAATDGPAGVAWSLNGSPEVVQPAGKTFDFPVTGLVSGTNRLVLTGIDANAKRGKPQPVTFTAVLGAPEVRLDSVVLADQEVPFRPGIGVGPDKKAKLKGTLTWLNPMKSVTWSLGDGKSLALPVNGSGASVPFLVQLPDDPPFGTVVVTVTATDFYDQSTTLKTFIDVTNLTKPQGAEGTVFADPRVGAGPLVITPETPLKGYFTAGKIRSADLLLPRGAVPSSVLQVTHDGSSLVVKDLKDGQFDGVKLRVVNDKGRTYDLDLGTLIGSTAAPVIALSSPLSGSWVRENLRIDGQVSDNNGINKLEWSIDNGRSWQQLDPPTGLGGPFSRQLTLPGPDNMVNLLVRASDTAGRTGTVLTVVRRDTQAPEINMTLPTLAPDFHGTAIAVGRFYDDGALQKAEVTLGKKTLVLPVDRPFALPVDADAQAGAPLVVRATDWAGNTSEQSFTLPVAAPVASPGPDAKPSVQILFPLPGIKGLNGTYPVVGRVVGFGSAPQVTVKGEATGTRNLDLTDGGYFTFDVTVTTLKDRSVTISAKGDGPDPATLSLDLPYDQDSEKPQARFLPMADKPVLTGNISVSGWIGDSRGVVSWVSQLDGGEKKTVVPDPSKPPVGTFLVDLGIPALGPHKLTVTPVNALGKEGAPVTTEFVSTSPAGPVEFTNLDLGASVVVTKDSRLQGRVPSINSWRRLEIQFTDLTSSDPWNGSFQSLDVRKNSDGVWTFDVPVPQNLPFTRIGVEVRGEDSLGQKVDGRTLFHRIWQKDAGAIQDNEGLFFIDNRLQDASGRFDTVPGVPLTGTFRGRPLKAVTLNPPVAALTVKADGNRITVDAKEEGIFGPFTVVATTVDNETFTSAALDLYADQTGPLVDWENPLNADWIKGAVAVKGKVTDPSGVASLEVSADAGTSWQPLPLKNSLYDATIPVTGPDGLVRVVLRAVDKAGNVSLVSRAVTKSTTAPAWTLVAPPAERKINGLTTIAGTAAGANPVASVEYSDDGKNYKTADGTDVFTFDLDFSSYTKVPDHFNIRTTDAAGNQAVTPLVLPVDEENDKPTVQIQTPAEGEVIRSDLIVSGMAFDDRGVKSISWRIDDGPWLKLDGVSSFQIPVALSTLTDNEHTVSVQAENINGTKGDISKTMFKVSLAAPEAVLFTPEVEKTVSGLVGLVGASFDRNGIQDVQISLDNGLSWSRADLKKKEDLLASSNSDLVKGYLTSQRQEWEWRFNSKTLKDGTYLVMVRSTDKYGTVGLYTTLVSLDNTAPNLTLTKPTDGLPVLDELSLEGRAADNIKLVSLKAEIRAIDNPPAPGISPASGPPGKAPAPAAPPAAVLLQTDLPVTPTFHLPWKLGSLAPGWYNLRLEAKDAAGNATYAARNFRVEGASADKVEILYPLTGETLNGSFFLEGRVTSRVKVENAIVHIDGKTKFVGNVDAQGYFQITLDQSKMDKGDHTVVVTVQETPSVTLTSEPRPFTYDPLGPWIHVTSHKSGSFVTQRPFILGEAGWTAPELDPKAPDAEVQAYRQAQESHRVQFVEISLDNGKTFTPAQGSETWKYRLESLGLPDGPQPILFRARFRDGTTAVQRLLVTVSQTAPTVQLLTPIENGRFNKSIDLAGFTQGNGEVQGVELAIRQGDKSGYEVPSFIQGMYLDAHFWGATYWEGGLGLTFFQDAVKLQAQVGQAPEGRFWGTVAGAKLIANILQLPAGYFFGPDWSWLSSSFGIGADFSQFSMNGTFLDFTSTPGVFLGGVVFQWEMARAKLKDLDFFKSYSWYTEATVWFISSDVQAEAKWAFSTGLRFGLF